jgi:hypothetical protein
MSKGTSGVAEVDEDPGIKSITDHDVDVAELGAERSADYTIRLRESLTQTALENSRRRSSGMYSEVDRPSIRPERQFEGLALDCIV